MYSHFLKKFSKSNTSLFWVLAVSKEMKKWKCSNVVINITPPFIFNPINRDWSCHKCKEKFSHHKILANFHIKSPPPPPTPFIPCTIKLLSYFVRNNMKPHYPCSWLRPWPKTNTWPKTNRSSFWARNYTKTGWSVQCVI